MKASTYAIIRCVAMIFIAAAGLSSYTDGSHYMTWFGIPLSQGGFAILMCVFLFFNIRSIMSAFKIDKALEEAKKQNEASLYEVRERAIKMEKLDGEPCVVSLTRPSKAREANMGVRVFLNGWEQGVLKNGGTLSMRTSYFKNELAAWYQSNNSLHTCEFMAHSGGNIALSLQYDKAEFSIDSVS